MNRANLYKLVIVAIGLFVSIMTQAQQVNPDYLRKVWKASWISVPETSPTDYGVYLFRKSFELTAKPESFPIYVSGDNRYKLFVNGTLVSLGPARGDILHWNYEVVDLAPYLNAGSNVISAKVWNEGEKRAVANISLKTGFILQGGDKASQIVNTNSAWKCLQDESYQPTWVEMKTMYVAGPGEFIDMNKHIQGWATTDFDDTDWKQAVVLAPGYPKNKSGNGGPNGWMLIPSTLPQVELKLERILKIRKAENVKVPASFPRTKTAITIPANSTATLLLDQTYLTNAYPTLIFSGGKGGIITLRYAEALYKTYPVKDNRNEIEGKTLIGRMDSIVSNGTPNQKFTSLSWRTYRYIEMKVTTQASPLTIDDIYGTFTGYPFTMNASLETDRTDLLKIMEIGWRTARLCAVDTYMDCPYYEQLQYIGDTRIQGLVSLYNSGDDRLLLNALNQFDYSRQPEGITYSRYPASIPQYITPYSLWYIAMLHDYMMYGKDTAFIQKKLLGARQILSYFKDYQQADGSLKDLPWWNFTDWVSRWSLGVRRAGSDGNSAVLDFQLLYAYLLAADMEEKVGIKEYAAIYTEEAEKLKNTIREKYWDNTRQLFADRSEKDLFSQHSNSLAILTGMVSGEEAKRIGNLMLTEDSDLSQASIYFKFYLHSALIKAGLGNDYLKWLGTWYEYIDLGLSTWGETFQTERTRSDCHAWGSSPNIEFFRTILGIDSDAVGFKKVKIEPHLGDITKIGGEMPHINGKIKVKYATKDSKINAEIELPNGVSGIFVWNEKSQPLKEGKNIIKM